MTAPHDRGFALADAAEWRLLALLLSRPRAGWREEVEALASEVRDAALRRAAVAARDASEGAYHALLGAGGIASPRAAAHAGFLDPGRILADLEARYAAFGFAPRSEEPDDHLAVECDFVAYLHLKEVYALFTGRDDDASVTREARERFVAEHVAVAGSRLVAKLPVDAPAHLLGAARSLAERLPAAAEAAGGGDVPDDDPLAGGCPVDGGPCSG
jgi:nitrate reductase assembly molybdenum cofactor insertion protein NarJ